MGEMQPSKRRRVYGFEPEEGTKALFFHNYMNYLLPALTKAITTTQENPDQEMEEIVRFEVDMALALSSNGFAWSHALKHRLEREKNTRRSQSNAQTHQATSTNLHLMYKCNSIVKLDRFSPSHLGPMFPPINPNPNPSSRRSRRKKRRMKGGEEEELGWRLRTLRRILPGGNEMGMGQLFPELESYVVCLELQVSILGSMVDIHGA